MSIELNHYLLIAAILFCVGLSVAVTRKNAIFVLIGIELMLNAANLNLVAFSQFDPDKLQGQSLALFVIVVAAAEAALALAIVLQVYKYYKTSNLDQLKKLRD